MLCWPMCSAVVDDIVSIILFILLLCAAKLINYCHDVLYGGEIVMTAAVLISMTSCHTVQSIITS